MLHRLMCLEAGQLFVRCLCRPEFMLNVVGKSNGICETGQQLDKSMILNSLVFLKKPWVDGLLMRGGCCGG